MVRTSAFLAVTVLMLGLLLVCLLLVAGDAPVRADEPEQPPLFPRHRVGHRAKVQNLDTLLALNPQLDPLYGNRKLVADDEILVAYSDGDKTGRWTLAVQDDLTMGKLVSQWYGPGFWPAMTAGDITGDGWDDSLVLQTSEPDGTHLSMTIAARKDGTEENTTYYTEASEQYTSGGAFPRVAAGNFDGDGQDDLVIAYVDSSKQVVVITYHFFGSKYVRDQYTDEEQSVHFFGNIDIATGDFDGDGLDEFVLAWTNAEGNHVVRLYDVDKDDFDIIPGGSWSGWSGGYSLSVASGQFDGDVADEIVLHDGEYIWTFDPGASTKDPPEEKDGGVYRSCRALHPESYDGMPFPNSIATGDFDGDGSDEVIHSCHEPIMVEGIDDSVWLVVYDINEKCEIYFKHEHSWPVPMIGGGGSLAVGDLNKDMRPEIVVGWSEIAEGAPDVQENHVEIFELDTNNWRTYSKGSRALPDVPPFHRLAVAVGDIDGDSIRVGQPTYQRVDDPIAKEILVVINEPPKHMDVIGGTTYDLNVDERGGRCPGSFGPVCTFAKYEQETTEESEMIMSTSRDWGISREVSGEFEEVMEASLKLSYGEGFEKTTSSIQEQTFGSAAETSHNDVIIRSETVYDVWEYPVYSDTTDVVQGHMVVVFPAKLDPECSENCAVDSVPLIIDGGATTAGYFPNHENHNLLSYSPNTPQDIHKLIKRGDAVEVGTNVVEEWFEWKDVEEDEEKRTSKLGVEIGLGVHAVGIKAELEGTYEREQVSTHKVSWEQSTSIRLRFNDLEAENSRYRVDPYIYWTSGDRHLALDYAAWPDDAWWTDTYTLPDPAINLPWKYDKVKNLRLLTRDLTFDPWSPTAGDTVTITAKVRNYSEHSAGNVKVRLYAGDPAADGKQIGTDRTIPELSAQSSKAVTVQFDTTGQVSDSLKIYVLVDPDNEIDEMHDETKPPNNNKAYAQLPVKPAESPPEGPVNLRITSKGIDFRHEALAAGQTVHISATVEAEGKAHALVAVEFWDGDPHQGGQFIDGELIPMILAGETATARAAWDATGKLGARDIWVTVVSYDVLEDLYHDNRAYARLDLPPYLQYLPLARKEF